MMALGQAAAAGGLSVWAAAAILVGSLLVLTFGAELLVRGAAAVAKGMGVSSFFIGLTIVGFGTSTPELFTSLIAAINGRDDIAVGNVVGSNIFNIALILGVTALICPIPIKVRVVRGEVLVVIAVALLPLLALTTGGVMMRWQGALLVAGLMAYLWRGYLNGRRENELEAAEAAKELESELGLEEGKRRSAWANVALIAVGLGLLVAGSHYLVVSASSIARGLGVSDLVIALTVVSAGTSAPELFTSLVAALRKQSDISVGNILGSNIFNIMGILGITCIVRPQTMNPQVLYMDVPVMIAASVALLPIMMSKHRISRAEGTALLVAYAAYLAVLIVLAPGWFGGGV